MEKRFSISVGAVLSLAVLLLGVLGAYAIGASRSDASPATPAQPGQAASTSTMVMEGIGEVSGVPDQVAFDLSVRAKADDVSTALAQSNARMRRVLAALADLGVEKKDVQTTGLSIDPVYHYPAYSSPVLEGYRATQRAEVLVRSLADGGKAISAVVNAGGDAVDVSDVRLELGGQAALLEKARDEAVAEAKHKAEQYATAAGQPLGKVVSLKEIRLSSPVPQYPVAYDMATAGRAAKSVPLRAGSEQVKVTVSVVWQLG